MKTFLDNDKRMTAIFGTSGGGSPPKGGSKGGGKGGGKGGSTGGQGGGTGGWGGGPKMPGGSGGSGGEDPFDVKISGDTPHIPADQPPIRRSPRSGAKPKSAPKKRGTRR